MHDRIYAADLALRFIERERDPKLASTEVVARACADIIERMNVRAFPVSMRIEGGRLSYSVDGAMAEGQIMEMIALN